MGATSATRWASGRVAGVLGHRLANELLRVGSAFRVADTKGRAIHTYLHEYCMRKAAIRMDTLGSFTLYPKGALANTVQYSGATNPVHVQCNTLRCMRMLPTSRNNYGAESADHQDGWVVPHHRYPRRAITDGTGGTDGTDGTPAPRACMQVCVMAQHSSIGP